MKYYKRAMSLGIALLSIVKLYFYQELHNPFHMNIHHSLLTSSADTQEQKNCISIYITEILLSIRNKINIYLVFIVHKY